MPTASTTAQTNPGGSLTASPSSGQAPLTVTFTGSASGRLEGVARLDYGDGQSDDSIPTVRGFVRTHTYERAGSYDAELKSGTDDGHGSFAFRTVARTTILAR
jgi:PKD repeat protein